MSWLVGFNTALSKTLISMLDREGPFVIDTKIAAHNIDLDDGNDWLDKDKITIGQDGQKVTKTDLCDFLTAVQKYGETPVFNNGRSYWFEGVKQYDRKSFRFIWGS